VRPPFASAKANIFFLSKNQLPAAAQRDKKKPPHPGSKLTANLWLKFVYYIVYYIDYYIVYYIGHYIGYYIVYYIGHYIGCSLLLLPCYLKDLKQSSKAPKVRQNLTLQPSFRPSVKSKPTYPVLLDLNNSLEYIS
jgi:hypothetical protein